MRRKIQEIQLAARALPLRPEGRSPSRGGWETKLGEDVRRELMREVLDAGADPCDRAAQESALRSAIEQRLVDWKAFAQGSKA
jgi:hypothetical protein